LTLGVRTNRVGSATLEMTLVGIPIIFVLISIFEMSRGMWVYHTLAYSVKAGTRFAAVHGQDCVTLPPTVTNNCAKTIADVAAVIENAGIGLDVKFTKLTFTPGGTACYFSQGSSPCSAVTSQWPPDGSNGIGQTIKIDIIVPFNSALAMFWPGTRPVSFALVNLGATSTEVIQF